jgi:hypothetical protein
MISLKLPLLLYLLKNALIVVDEATWKQRGRDCDRKVTVVMRLRQWLWTRDREVTVVVRS